MWHFPRAHDASLVEQHQELLRKFFFSSMVAASQHAPLMYAELHVTLRPDEFAKYYTLAAAEAHFYWLRCMHAFEPGRGGGRRGGVIGAYTPRWDPCRLRIGDADHVEVVLPLGNGEEEVLAFVRATAPLLLEWEDESSPARGFARVFDACGLPPPAGSSLFAGLADWLHHSQHTVVVDQALILFPALLLGGWQLSESNAALQRLIVAAAGLYCVVACLRLRHLGYIQ